MPVQVCTQCIHYLNKAYTFRQLCERSDSILREHLRKVEHRMKIFIDNNKLESHIKTEIKPESIETVNGDVDQSNLRKKEDALLDFANDFRNDSDSDFGDPLDDTRQPIFPCEDCTLCFISEEDLKVCIDRKIFR